MRSLPYGHLAQRRPAFGTHRRLFRPDGGSVPVLTGEPAAGIASASPEEAARSLPARQRPAAERAGVLPAFLCSGRGFAAWAFRSRLRAVRLKRTGVPGALFLPRGRDGRRFFPRSGLGLRCRRFPDCSAAGPFRSRGVFRQIGASVSVTAGETAAREAGAAPERTLRAFAEHQFPAASRACGLPVFLCSGRGFAARAFRARFRAFCVLKVPFFP